MAVDHRGGSVRGPAGVPDAQAAGGHFLGEPVDQGVDLGRALDHRGLVRVLVVDRHPGRVVATVLEALQALHDDGSRRALTQVADDPAHTLYSLSEGA